MSQPNLPTRAGLCLAANLLADAADEICIHANTLAKLTLARDLNRIAAKLHRAVHMERTIGVGTAAAAAAARIEITVRHLRTRADNLQKG